MSTNPNKPEQAVRYLEVIVQPLCFHTTELTISSKTDERGLLLNLMAHTDDLSRIIGRKGMNAHALRNLTRLWGQTNGAVVSLLINGAGQDFYKTFEERMRERK